MRLFKKKIADSIEDQIVKTITEFNQHMDSSYLQGYDAGKKARVHQNIGTGVFVTGALAMAGTVGALAISLSVAPALLTGAAIGGVTTFGVAFLGTGGVSIAGLAYKGIAKLVENSKAHGVERDLDRKSKLVERLNEKLTTLLGKSEDFSLKDLDNIRSLTRNKNNKEEVQKELDGYKRIKKDFNI
jgi:hypothetical protein